MLMQSQDVEEVKLPPPVKRYSMTLGIFKVLFGRRLSNVDPYTLDFLVSSHTIFRRMNHFAIILLMVILVKVACCSTGCFMIPVDDMVWPMSSESGWEDDLMRSTPQDPQVLLLI